jgi:hypothetical protein
MPRTYKKIDLENINISGPEKKTISIPARSKVRYFVGVFVILILASAVVLLNWNSVSHAMFVRGLVGN